MAGLGGAAEVVDAVDGEVAVGCFDSSLFTGSRRSFCWIGETSVFGRVLVSMGLLGKAGLDAVGSVAGRFMRKIFSVDRAVSGIATFCDGSCCWGDWPNCTTAFGRML